MGLNWFKRCGLFYYYFITRPIIISICLRPALHRCVSVLWEETEHIQVHHKYKWTVYSQVNISHLPSYFNLKAKGTLDWKPKSISWGLWGHLHFSHWSYWMNERLIIIVISYEQLMFCVNDNLSLEICIVFVFCILYYTYMYIALVSLKIFSLNFRTLYSHLWKWAGGWFVDQCNVVFLHFHYKMYERLIWFIRVRK